jgi:hypothetical protein
LQRLASITTPAYIQIRRLTPMTSIKCHAVTVKFSLAASAPWLARGPGAANFNLKLNFNFKVKLEVSLSLILMQQTMTVDTLQSAGNFNSTWQVSSHGSS